MMATEAVFTEVRTWPTGVESPAHVQEEVLGREVRARLIRTFQHSVVPGLLQTADYARRLLSMLRPDERRSVAAMVAGRMDRQVVLYDEEKRFEFLITEAALRWRPGPVRTLLAQLDRISSITTLENVSVGLILEGQEATVPNSHGFSVYSGDDGDMDTFVEVETIHANLIIGDSDAVARYLDHWMKLSGMAIYGDEARKHLVNLAEEFRDSAGR